MSNSRRKQRRSAGARGPEPAKDATASYTGRTQSIRLNKIKVHNFRLLQSVELSLKERTTVVVGRNNSGKTSLTELFRRLLDDNNPRFTLEDFSLQTHKEFWKAFELHNDNEREERVRAALPCISASLFFEYDKDLKDIGALGGFIIDLDADCTETRVNLVYELGPGKITSLFDGLDSQDRKGFYKALGERLPKTYKARLEAEDPNDPTNKKSMELSQLRPVIQSGFVDAQRALDARSQPDKAVLGKIIEALFTAATAEQADPAHRTTAEKLQAAVATVQEGLNTDFNDQLTRLLPTFSLFGYPGLTDPKLRTETTLDVQKLLLNHTCVGYEGANGVNLPECHNGLGPRNLIFILLKLVELYRAFKSAEAVFGVHLIFIEEPEAHLHPQMQSVFVRKLADIVDLFVGQDSTKEPWPVQFVVTTHSPHIANEAPFDSMRYFLARPCSEAPDMLTTEIKDLSTGLGGTPAAEREFLHKYMTLTRCDLLFADKAVLIEGASERLFLPKMIEKIDAKHSKNLGSQYVTVMEVGGAYAHVFFGLIDFLELHTAVITDLDTVSGDDSKKCKVSVGTQSSNACINKWFETDSAPMPTKDELLAKTVAQKTKAVRRLTYQIPEVDGGACGRSFEDAFMLANPVLFSLNGHDPGEREDEVWNKASNVKKTEFALEHAIAKPDAWVTPRYIEEGLLWLADSGRMTTVASSDPSADIQNVNEEVAPNA